LSRNEYCYCDVVTDDEDDFLYSEEALDIIVEAMRVGYLQHVQLILSAYY